MTRPVMVFAAGFGTRMGPLTADRPKPLIEVAGKALLDHALDLAVAIAPPTIVVNTHYLADQVEAHVAENPNVRVSLELPDVLETGGGVRHALPLLGADPIITMNSDAVWNGPNPLDLVLAEWDPDRMDALLLTVPPNQAVGHSGKGDFLRDAVGRISRGPGEIYTGVQILKTDRLNEVAEAAFSLNVVWDAMLAEGRLYGTSYPGHWCDVGRPEGIALAEAMLAANA